MPLFRRNQPNHSILLMPVRLRSERWPKNKVQMLSCDADGDLFTQVIGRSVYRRIKEEAERREVSKNNYAIIYWDSGTNKYIPIIVEIGDKENWALERVLEHAFRNAVIPNVLVKPLREIIKLGDDKYRELTAERTKSAKKTMPPTSLKVLNRLPYYSKNTVEVSIPIYKAKYNYPLIILKRLNEEKNLTSRQQLVLILDSDGDLATVTLTTDQINRAERKLSVLHERGKEGSLVCLWQPDGVSVDAMEINQVQRLALNAVIQYFNETGMVIRPHSDAVNKVLNQVGEITTPWFSSKQ